jgi:hypothetical protein
MASTEAVAAARGAPEMALALRVAPELIKAVPAAAGDFAWTATFSAVLLETGGVGGRIYAVQAVLLEAGRGPGGPTDRQVARAEVDLTRNSLRARGSLAVPITVHYTLPGGERDALIDVAAIVVGNDGYYHHAAQRFRIG